MHQQPAANRAKTPTPETVAETLSSPAHPRRVFVDRGHVAHLIDATDPTLRSACLRCGRHPVPGNLWRGTRTREQRARAASLPLCQPLYGNANPGALAKASA